MHPTGEIPDVVIENKIMLPFFSQRSLIRYIALTVHFRRIEVGVPKHHRFILY
jgi:hypothetical protein